jgi:pimeloyl-ACP methyl ester carboxylesterase
MPYATVAGERLFYALVEKDPSRQQNLILVHGAGGDHTHWPAELRRLAGFNVYALDLPGHGRSPGQGRTSVQDYAGTVDLFAQALELRQASIAGHSMGGAIAQELALRHPRWLVSVVLIGTGARLRVAPDILEGLSTDFEAAIDTICRRAYGDTASQHMLRKGRQQLLGVDPAVIHGDYVACDTFDVMDRVSDIRLPTLIISGGADQMTPPKYGQYLHQCIGGSEWVEIREGGHMMALEKPLEVARAVERFLKESQGHPKTH